VLLHIFTSKSSQLALAIIVELSIFVSVHLGVVRLLGIPGSSPLRRVALNYFLKLSFYFAYWNSFDNFFCFKSQITFSTWR